MNTTNTHTHNEQGVVSIFTVLMFMIFVSVIAVGFIKIVSDEQRQASDNDLSASAYASAQSGVEEAKRILMFCQMTSVPAEQAACAGALDNTSCTAVSGQAALMGALNITVDTSNGRQEGVVSSDSGYEQRWTCMTINTQTDSVKDVAIGSITAPTPGEGVLIPLKSQSAYNKLRFSWHNPATTDGTPSGYPVSTNKPSQPNWTASGYPAAVRLEFISYPKGSGVDINTIDAPTRTVVLFPSSLGTSPTAINVAAVDGRQGDPNTRTAITPNPVHCSNATQYLCVADLDLSTMPNSPATHDYFVRVTAMYASTHALFQLYDGAVLRNFDNVQPRVDVTGRANDVFRRIESSLQFGSDVFMPNYAIQSGHQFCKNMIVADVAAASADICNP